jgi:hypothetical protein
MRDQHFSIVTKALEKYIHKHQKCLSSAQDVVNALNSSALYLCQEKAEQNIKTGKSIAVRFNPLRTETCFDLNKRIIKEHTTYYNLHNLLEDGQFQLCSSIFSDRSKRVKVDSEYSYKKVEFKIKQNFKRNRVREILDSTLKKKINKLRQRKNKILKIISMLNFFYSLKLNLSSNVIILFLKSIDTMKYQ